MSSMSMQSATLGAAGSSTAFVVKAPAAQGIFGPGYLPPGILCNVSSGAVLTYQIEVTGDNTAAPGYVPATGNWVPFTNLSGLTGAACDALGAAVRGIRITVTSWTSGTVTFQFVQVVE